MRKVGEEGRMRRMRTESELPSEIALFAGIAPEERQKLLGCMAAVRRSFGKGEYIVSAGESAGRIGLVLKGCVCVVKEDYWGNRSILTRLTAGDLFGEAFACSGMDKMPVSVVATDKSDVLLLDYARLMNTCRTACSCHTAMIRNLVRELAEKSVRLTEKMEHTLRRTTKEKLLSYLSAEAERAGKPSFSIPFNRQELADFLAVDRSAMSAALCRLRDEGVLEFSKNRFRLL